MYAAAQQFLSEAGPLRVANQLQQSKRKDLVARWQMVSGRCFARKYLTNAVRFALLLVEVPHVQVPTAPDTSAVSPPPLPNSSTLAAREKRTFRVLMQPDISCANHTWLTWLVLR
jgi:hypothetical protein